MTRLLECTSLDLLAREGVNVAPYVTVETPEAACQAAMSLGTPAVVKAQVPAGGRAKAGGVVFVETPEEAGEAARSLLGRPLGNFPVEKVLIQARVEVQDEYFCAFTFDSMSRRPLALFSARGGVDVEELLRDQPAALVSRPIEAASELPEFVAREIVESAGLTGPRMLSVAWALVCLYRLFRGNDASLVEVNPLVVDGQGKVMALSGVVTSDDQAFFRHPEWAEMIESDASNGWRPLTPLERRIREIDATDSSSSIRFNEFPEGTIACLLTGGGSGLLTFDHFRRVGETPATTFDITPGRVEEKMYLATKAILGRAGLEGLIAGGNITNFIPIDVKVQGVVRALKEVGVDARRFPLVFRYAGPGVESARKLAETIPGLEFFDHNVSLEAAVERIVNRVRQFRRG